MSQKDKYFQFPLSLLTQVKTLKKVDSQYRKSLGLVECWAIHHAGADYLEKIRDEYSDFDMPDEECHNQSTDDYDQESEIHKSLAWGADTIGVNIRSFDNTEAQFDEAQCIVGFLEAEYGRSPTVRLAKKLYFEARDTPERMKPRDIICYMAVLAIVGNEKFKQVSYDRILWAAHGCKNQKMFETTVAEPWLSIKQIRQGVERMQTKGFIMAVCVSRRFRYYSVRMSREKLEAAVRAHLAKRAETKSSRETIHIKP
jgi:hypothetical protein